MKRARPALLHGIFRLEDWLPYQCSFVSTHVSALLARMYGEEFGLSVTGWRIVAVLGSHAPLSAKRLAELTAMDQVSISRSVNRLVRLKLLLRRADPQDRRKVVLRLSKRGEDAYNRVLPLARAAEAALLEGLDKEDVAHLRALMDSLVQRASEIFSDEADWRDYVLQEN
jgi:DNA-binding MarR family transcriptional regulator